MLRGRLIDFTIYAVLAVFCFLTLYPFWSILIISFSTPEAYFRNQFHIIPTSFSLDAYILNFANASLIRSFFISVSITVVGTANSMFWTMITAYFLSKQGLFLVKTVFVLFLFTMFFDGGLIPNFVLIRQLGLRNNLLSVILPFTINVYFLILMKNYFTSLPKSLEEAAYIDGANAFTILFRIIAPSAKPIIATISLFYAVSYWNNWFWPMIYLSDRDLFPLALYLRNIVSQSTALVDTGVVGLQIPATIRAAAIVITIMPIILVYPFIQKYFVKGIMLGATKE